LGGNEKRANKPTKQKGKQKPQFLTKQIAYFQKNKTQPPDKHIAQLYLFICPYSKAISL